MAIRIDANTMDKVRLAADLMTQQAKPVAIANAVRAVADGEVVAPLLRVIKGQVATIDRFGWGQI